MTWNVHHHEEDRYKTFIRRVLQNQRAHVVAFQELPEELWQELYGLDGFNYGHPQITDAPTRRGIGFLSKRYLGKFLTRWLPHISSEKTEHRAIYRTWVSIGGRRVWFYNTHVSSHNVEAQTHWVFQFMMRELNRQSRKRDAFVLMGDFNADPHKLRKIRGYKRFRAKFTNLSPQLITYPQTDQHIDYLFISKRRRILQVRQTYAPKVHSSDHRPLISVLRVKT